MAAATSSTFPTRPRGMAARADERTLSPSAAVMSVSMNPGATASTVMPREPTSRHRLLVSPMSPALAAE